MSPLPSDDRRALLDLARRAIVETVHGRALPKTAAQSPLLTTPASAFVTLHLRRRLRGCIGQIEPVDPLAETVASCAVAAALRDPRFDPVEPQDIAQLEIEISVLSPRVVVRPEEIEVGKHGLLVSRGRMRGLLLPQVAEQFHWTAERFLEETCHKAGLDGEAWRDPITRIEAFTAEVFSEADFRPQQHAQAS